MPTMISAGQHLATRSKKRQSVRVPRDQTLSAAMRPICPLIDPLVWGIAWSTSCAGAGRRVRLGFHYEGLFRQAMITRGRNRDTAWFSVIDRDWLALLSAIMVLAFYGLHMVLSLTLERDKPHGRPGRRFGNRLHRDYRFSAP
jgi:hypothetical protein